MEYYFDFSEKLEEQNGIPTTIIGSPEIQEDPVTRKKAAFFDGRSAILLPSISFDQKNFVIECIFRNMYVQQEQGVFGSNGFRTALRSNRKHSSYTFWANFPSSVDKRRVTYDLSNNPELMTAETYVAASRKDNTFSLYVNNELVGSFDYNYNFWSHPIYIGYYYDLIYGFNGFIREFKLSLNKSFLPNPASSIPNTLRGTTNYELG